MTAANQKSVITNWNKGRIPLLLTHYNSLGYGVNLQNAEDSVIIWYTPPWSGTAYLQTNARLWRQGRKTPVLVYRFACNNTIDVHRVLPRLEIKIKKQEQLLRTLEIWPKWGWDMKPGLMFKLYALVLRQLQKRCTHPNVTADISEGNSRTFQIQWCRVCGAYRIISPESDPPSLHTINEISWRVPRPDWIWKKPRKNSDD